MTEQGELTEGIIEAIQDKKGSKIVKIDLSDIMSAPASTLIICQGKSTSQVGAIADNIRDHLLAEYGQKPWHYEGYRNSQWIVIDYSTVTVHVFLPEYREFYSLEDLCSDGRREDIADID